MSAYLEEAPSVQTSQTNLTETVGEGALGHHTVPEVFVTSEFATKNYSSPHRKLAATFSAPPTFPTFPTAFSGPTVNHTSDSDSSSGGSKKARGQLVQS